METIEKDHQLMSISISYVDKYHRSENCNLKPISSKSKLL